MPKKSSNSAESRKRRSSSAKDARNQSNEEILLPPTPTASHLVASNPFDDPPPSNPAANPPGFQGPPAHVLMHSSLRMPGVMNEPMPNHHGPMRGPMFDPTGGSPGWRGPMMPGPNFQAGPGPPRPEFSRPGMIPGQYPPHREMGNFGPPYNFTPPQPTRREKVPKNDGNIWPPKSRKKTKSSDVHVGKPAAPRTEENWVPEQSPSSTNKTHSSPPVGKSVPPHSIPPAFPTSCLECMKDIKYPSEDCICCLASCKHWYHRTCTGLTEAAYECLRGEELALWSCDNCLHVKEIESVRLRNPESQSGENCAPLLQTKA